MQARPAAEGEDSYTGLLAEPGTPLAGGARLNGQFQTMPVQPIRTGGQGRSSDTPATPPCMTPQSSAVAASGALSDASAGAAGAPDVNGGGGGAATEERLPKKKVSDDGLLRKVTKVGLDLKQLMRADKGALAMLGDDAVGGRAHDNRIECIMVQHPYIFTASAANQACDAQIRMWVLSHEKGTLQCALAPRPAHCAVAASFCRLCRDAAPCEPGMRLFSWTALRYRLRRFGGVLGPCVRTDVEGRCRTWLTESLVVGPCMYAEHRDDAGRFLEGPEVSLGP